MLLPRTGPSKTASSFGTCNGVISILERLADQFRIERLFGVRGIQENKRNNTKKDLREIKMAGNR